MSLYSISPCSHRSATYLWYSQKEEAQTKKHTREEGGRPSCRSRSKQIHPCPLHQGVWTTALRSPDLVFYGTNVGVWTSIAEEAEANFTRWQLRN